MLEKPLVNNQIRAKEVRVIDETGKQLGILPLEKAIQIAQERNLDLIQVTEKLEIPVCRLMNYGKYAYQIQKKERKSKQKTAGVVKRIRLGFNISEHDLKMKACQGENFIKKGYKIIIELPLRGREKSLGEFAKNKIEFFIQELQKLIPIKIERELKKEPRGFTLIITKD